MTSFASHPSPPHLNLKPDPTGEPRDRSQAERTLWMLVGIAMLGWATDLFGWASTFPLAVIPTVLAGAWGISVAIVSWLPVENHPLARRYGNILAWLTAIVMVLLLAIWAYVQIHASPGYTTDELSFDQYAAQLLQHGFNPYTHSMASAGPSFGLPADAYTYTLTGKPVLQLSYPALSFLVYLPFMWLGWTTEVGAGVNVLGFAVTILVMFALLPRRIRAAGLLLATIGVYRAFAAGGVTDMLYIPLLVVAAYRWDRFGQSRSTYIGPLALGLAMAVKQTPWPVLAFVVAALVCDELDRNGIEDAIKRGGRYLAAVLIAFVIPNLAFIVLSPHAWWNGVFTPFTQQLVPSGQGVVMFSLFLHMGGGSMTAFSVAMALLALLTLLVFVGSYPLLRRATFALPVIAYFFAARSQTNYLIALFPAALVGAATSGPAVVRVGRSAAGLLRSRRWALSIVCVSLLSLVAVVYALASPAPLRIRITGIRTGFQGSINQFIVRVKNTSGSPVRPRFAVQSAQGISTFWSAYGGPVRLRPEHDATYRLVSPNSGANPNVNGAFSVVGYTARPGTVSTSHRFLRRLLRTVLIPQAIDSPVPLGKRITIRAQIMDRFNNTVSRAGVPVYLTQLYYNGLGGTHGTAKINGGHPGSLAVVRTNRHGVAVFTVVGTKASFAPVVFLAHLHNQRAQYNYGQSTMLDIRFSSR